MNTSFKLRLGIAIGVAFFSIAGTGLSEGESVSLQNVHGKVIVIRGTSTIEATEGMEIQAGDSIKTELGGAVDMIQKDKWGCRMLGQTDSVLLEDAQPNIRIEMMRGDIIVHVKKQSSGDTFQLTTPVAVAAVRGTQFWGRVEPSLVNPDTTLAVRKGQIEVTIPATGETYFLNEGQALDIRREITEPLVREALIAEMQAIAQADEIPVTGLPDIDSNPEHTLRGAGEESAVSPHLRETGIDEPEDDKPADAEILTKESEL